MTPAAVQLKETLLRLLAGDPVADQVSYSVDDESVVRIARALRDRVGVEEALLRYQWDMDATVPQHTVRPATVPVLQYDALLAIPGVRDAIFALPAVQSIVRAYLGGQLPPSMNIQPAAVRSELSQSLGTREFNAVPNVQGEQLRRQAGLPTTPDDDTVAAIMDTMSSSLMGSGAYLLTPESLPRSGGLRVDDVSVFALLLDRGRFPKREAREMVARMLRVDKHPSPLSAERAAEVGYREVASTDWIFLRGKPDQYSLMDAVDLRVPNRGIVAVLARQVQPEAKAASQQRRWQQVTDEIATRGVAA